MFSFQFRELYLVIWQLDLLTGEMQMHFWATTSTISEAKGLLKNKSFLNAHNLVIQLSTIDTTSPHFGSVQW